MKTYLMGLLATVMMLFGTTAMALGEEGSGHSSTTKLEVKELKPVVEGAAAEPAPGAKPVKHYKRGKSGKSRAKDLDFRHCLELEDNAAIAQCAQEQ